MRLRVDHAYRLNMLQAAIEELRKGTPCCTPLPKPLPMSDDGPRCNDRSATGHHCMLPQQHTGDWHQWWTDNGRHSEVWHKAPEQAPQTMRAGDLLKHAVTIYDEHRGQLAFSQCLERAVLKYAGKVIAHTDPEISADTFPRIPGQVVE